MENLLQQFIDDPNHKVMIYNRTFNGNKVYYGKIPMVIQMHSKVFDNLDRKISAKKFVNNEFMLENNHDFNALMNGVNKRYVEIAFLFKKNLLTKNIKEVKNYLSQFNIENYKNFFEDISKQINKNKKEIENIKELNIAYSTLLDEFNAMFL